MGHAIIIIFTQERVFLENKINHLTITNNRYHLNATVSVGSSSTNRIIIEEAMGLLACITTQVT